jgi:death-on-curing protein
MKDIVFLTIDDVLKLHRHQVDVYGGEYGVWDFGLLESAVLMPQSMFGGKFLHEDIFEMASAYLFHLAKNHPFIDGNKRAGAIAAYVFLAINGVKLTASPGDFTDMVLAVAESRLDKPGIANFFRNNTEFPP